MAQIRGTAGYNLGAQNTFGGPSRGDTMNDPSPLDAIREQTSKIEDFLDTMSDPVKPYVRSTTARKTPPRELTTTVLLGYSTSSILCVRNLLTSNFQIFTSNWAIPDCCHIPGGCAPNLDTVERSASVPPRLPTQYAQSSYVETKLIDSIVPYGLTHLFLIVNVLAMISCSTLVIARKYSDYAVAGLIGVVVTQALGYGLIFDLNFFLRNLSVMGGLLMVLSDSWVRKSKAFAGLPQIDEKDRKMYFQLAGRVLLIFLFIGFVFSGKWSIWRVMVALLGFVACVMVVVGFKAKFSAIMLVVILSVFNLLVNNFWTVSLDSNT